MVEMFPIGSPETLPKAAPYRSARQKYPWTTIKPGEWFPFAEGVKPASARVMASNMGNALALKLSVFAGMDGKLYCRRVDGLPPDERWASAERDNQGNVILQQAELHPASEKPPEPAGRVVEYGYGAADNNAPMYGEHEVKIAGLPARHPREGINETEDEI